MVRNKLQNVSVKLPDGRSFRGKVTALDIATDLAIVKLEGVRDKLPSMKLGVVSRRGIGGVMMMMNFASL